ncbi:unnamed protein product [Caenorhabditis nigoni]
MTRKRYSLTTSRVVLWERLKPSTLQHGSSLLQVGPQPYQFQPLPSPAPQVNQLHQQDSQRSANVKRFSKDQARISLRCVLTHLLDLLYLFK